MKFEISDDAVLTLSGVGCAAYGIAMLSAPKQFQDHHAAAGYTTRSDAAFGWIGQECLLQSGMAWAAHTSDDTHSKKNMLKVFGAGWTAAAARMVYEAENGITKREVAYPSALGCALVGGLCLWRGLDDNGNGKDA